MPETPLTEEQMIGARIRQVRQQRDMSQAALAAKAGLSLPHISDIELGKVSMRISSFVRIVEALQVSADYAFALRCADCQADAHLRVLRSCFRVAPPKSKWR